MKKEKTVLESQAFLEFTDVNFTYPQIEDEETKPVFDHFYGELPSGFVSLVGPNGCGKTTLLLLASARLCPSSGCVKLLGTDTRNFFPVIRVTKENGTETQEIAKPKYDEEERNLFASVIYQNMEFETDETVENLLRQVLKNGKCKNKDDSFFTEIKDVCELQNILSHPLTKLSKGEIQRVLIAFSLLYGSNSIFMDEPLFAMEYNQKEKILSYLVNYSKKNNITIYISMHELELTKKYSQSVILFYPDRSMALGTPEEVLTDEELEKAFGVPSSQLRNTERLTREQLAEAAKVEKQMEDELNKLEKK